MTDDDFMRRCLALAAQYRGRTAPNPIVGCVIVRDGQILAEGVHRGPGTAHAEIDALAKLGLRAEGATLYCNLEPCNHHGRTPPCAPVVRDAGLARVVIGAMDPIASHAGGASLLPNVSRALEAECIAANRPFFTWARSKRPMFTLKAGITLDGKIATVRGESQWITGEAARADVMRLRNEHDAVLVGIGTVLADDPKLTARIEGGRDPVRIVLDSQLRTPPKAAIARAGTIIVCAKDAPAIREKRLVAKGVEVWRAKQHTIPVDRLIERHLHAILVEGGGEVHASLLKAGLADEIVLYVAPTIVGGPAKSWVGGKGVAKLADAYGFVVDDATMLGSDVRIRLHR